MRFTFLRKLSNQHSVEAKVAATELVILYRELVPNQNKLLIYTFELISHIRPA